MKSLEERLRQQAAVRALVEIARAGLHEDLRQNQRFPFFQPVTIAADDQGTISLSAFSRDISENGVGLLLYWPLRLRPVNLRIHLGEGNDVALTGYVQWCQACGYGWYVAGVSFDEEDTDEFVYYSSPGYA